MADTMSHLRNMKRRFTQGNSQGDLSPAEKVDQLENTLNVFRAEVDMKLKIMQQILTTRNEQVTVQKKLLEREQTLYDTLLGHWKNTPKLAATGLSVSFSAADIIGGEENEENLSDPDYMEGDEPGPSRKKSKSSLRRQRKSGKPMPKQHKMKLQAQQDEGAGAETKGADDGTFQQEEGDNGDGTFTNTDDQDQDNEWDVELEPRSPPVQVQMKNEVEDEEDVSNFDEFNGPDIEIDEDGDVLGLGQEQGPSNKKSRTLYNYGLAGTFASAESALANVKSAKAWRLRNDKTTEKGRTLYYDCKTSRRCPVKMYLVFQPNTLIVHCFSTGNEHNHPLNQKQVGIPIATRHEIDALFFMGVTKPRQIVHALREKGVLEPTTSQLNSYLKTIRMKSTGMESSLDVSLGESASNYVVATLDPPTSPSVGGTDCPIPLNLNPATVASSSVPTPEQGISSNRATTTSASVSDRENATSVHLSRPSTTAASSVPDRENSASSNRLSLISDQEPALPLNRPPTRPSSVPDGEYTISSNRPTSMSYSAPDREYPIHLSRPIATLSPAPDREYTTSSNRSAMSSSDLDREYAVHFNRSSSMSSAVPNQDYPTHFNRPSSSIMSSSSAQDREYQIPFNLHPTTMASLARGLEYGIPFHRPTAMPSSIPNIGYHVATSNPPTAMSSHQHQSSREDEDL